jgi:hypothetical protein
MPRITKIILAVAALSLLVAASSAIAANHKSSSSISLMPLSSARTVESGPAYGDAVTFSVSTNATQQPFVHLKCGQNASLVLESWQAWFYGAVGTQSFDLGPSPAWQSGAADCTAYLENWDSYYKNGKTSVLASTSFHVNA